MKYEIKVIKREGYKPDGYLVINTETKEPERCFDGVVWFHKSKKIAMEFAADLNNQPTTL